MKMFATLCRAAVLTSLLVGTSAYADALVATDPTQLGRLSRNAIPQDWSHFEANPLTNGEQFPGIINPTSTYHYHVYYYNVGMTPFVEIYIDSTAATTFFSAYQTFYNPGNLAQDWLGDAGTSGNSFGVDPLSFQVVAGINTTLAIIVNESTTNGGIGLPFTLLVSGYTDSMYSNGVDLTPVAAISRIPEPSTIALLALAPLALFAGRRTRKQRSNDASLALAA